MVEKLKLWGGLILALYPYDRDFTGFECPMRSISHALEKSSLIGL